jgi:uncharacterized membrane protein YeaQ/YmgE (transglycosylase-associated protein family)
VWGCGDVARDGDAFGRHSGQGRSQFAVHAMMRERQRLTGTDNGAARMPGHTTGGYAMGIIVWILVGLLVGVGAQPFMPGRRRRDRATAVTVGIAGALLGGSAWQVVVGPVSVELTLGNSLAALAGSVLLLAGYRASSRARLRLR